MDTDVLGWFKRHYDRHPDRTEREIQEWAFEHDLPYFDDQVHFPDKH